MRNIFYGFIALGGALVVSAQKADDYKVTSLPGIDIDSLNFTQYAGHIELDSKSNANMFFWMIEREIKTEPEKLIIWLNGGPGCSSMDGLFLENGPFRVNKDLTLTINEGGWQNYATNIFVDQPVGTGFSFVATNELMTTMDKVSDQFVAFIDKLFETFPNLSQQDLYIAGESFAGQYIPYFTAKLLELNKKKKNQYNIQGIAIGNGWISAEHQYNAYYDFSVQNNLVDSDRLPLMSAHLKTCQEDIKDKETIHISSCEKIMSDVVDSSIHEDKNGVQKCINMYDIRLKEEDSPYCGLSWPYELDDVTKYLRLPELKKAIHAEKQLLGWKECTSVVSTALSKDNSKPAYHLLPDILKEIPVLLFSGEFDLICNYVGTEYLIGNMTWNGGRGFTKKHTKKEIWKIDDKLAGYYTQERNLTYVLIKDGSHMVPYDRPIECLDMINRFIQVGNNIVKGRISQVGDRTVVSPSPSSSSVPVSTPSSKDDKSNKSTDSAEQQDKDTTSDDKWGEYYSWGTTTLIFVILFAISLCWCWLRTRNRPSSASAAVEFGGAPQQQREDIKKRSDGILGFVTKLFSNKVNGRKKFRLGDNEESNELDELVIETPMLFEAEESDDDQVQQQQQKQVNSFAIDDNDEEDDDFEDFADFDDGEALTSSAKKYKRKD